MLFLENQGFIKVYFADESGFSLTPDIPYGWQPVNQPIRIKTARSKRLNTFGLLTRKNELDAYTFWGSATAAMIIGFIDDFVKKMTQRTVIVIDNATVHHSDEFHDKIEEWKELDIDIFYLPRYSPNLNIIETLWRKIKYEWLKPHDYLNLKTLEAAIDNILIKFGIDFSINFENKKVSII
ncbi:MAG: transposase [Saprospiraceae bacterium]